MTDKTIKKEEIKGIPEGSIAFPETEKSYAIAKETLCPVCGAKAKEFVNSQTFDGLRLDCPNCGRFDITRTLQNIAGFKNLSQNEKNKISTYLKEYYTDFNKEFLLHSVNFAQISSIPENFIEEARRRYREKGISYDRSLYEFAHQYKNLRLPKKLEQSFHELIQKVEEQLPAEQCRTNAVTRSVLRQIKPFIKTNTVIVLCAKGIEAETGKMLSEIAEDEISAATIAILSGPGFAVDIAQRKLTSVTIACAKDGLAAQLTDMLATPYFRPYTTSDMISPQIGGSVKNVIAIASGVIEGAEFGDGARAALITRGLNEMGRLSGALGGRHDTMMGMCGLGDLVLTAGCSQSRNFSFGYEIGIRGEARKLIEENTRTVEGIYTAQAVVRRACELGIEMPICEVVNKVLFAGISIKSAMESLMSRPYKEEGF